MNLYRNEFELLSEQVIIVIIIPLIIDVLMISETKVDDNFPTADFVVDSFNAECHAARATKGERFMLFC